MTQIHEWTQGEYTISTDKARLDIPVIHAFLGQAYWSTGLPRTVLLRSIEHSLVFGLYHGEQQAGFARVITDRATFAYLSDVFVLETFQGRGLGQWLVSTILAHPDLQGLRRFLLATLDAHGLYRKFGFTPLQTPERWMEIRWPDVYSRTSQEESGG